MNQSVIPGSTYRLSELLQGYADVDPSQDCEISELSLDSRYASKGDLFFACAGTQKHGLEYIDQVMAADVAAVAWEPSEAFPALPESVSPTAIPLIAVDSLSERLGFIADRFFGQPSRDLQVVGITGTDGKTSCAHFLTQALNRLNRKTAMIGTLGYGLPGDLQVATHTTPDAIRVHRILAEMKAQGVGAVVMEVSSHALDQSRVNGVLFDLVMLTNIGRDHLDYHGEQQKYVDAKKKLFRFSGLKFAVINKDDTQGRQWLNEIADDIQIAAYGEQDCIPGKSVFNVQLEKIKLGAQGISWQVSSPWGQASLQCHLFGRFNSFNLSAVLTALHFLGVDWDQACEQVGKMTTVPGRMEFYQAHKGSRQPVVVVDFAHTPDALEQALLALREHGFARVCVVFGCGGDRDTGKRSLMGAVAERLADKIVLTDDNPRTEPGNLIIDNILSGIGQLEKVQIERDRKQAIAWAIKHAGQQDVVLVAGKGHEQYQITGDQKVPFNDAVVVQACLKGGLH